MEISKSVDSALRVLDHLALQPNQTVAQIADVLDLNRTVTHRLLTTLRARRYVRRIGNKGPYALGARLLEITGEMYSVLSRLAAPVLHDLTLETGETSILFETEVSKDGTFVTAVGQSVAKNFPLQVEYLLGVSSPIEHSAAGRSILAFMDSGQFVPRTESLRSRLENIRSYGFERSEEEIMSGVAGVAVPIFDDSGSPSASLSIAVPLARKDKLESLIAPLEAASQKIQSLASDRLLTEA